MRLLKLLHASEAAPGSFAIDTDDNFAVDNILMPLNLKKLFNIVNQAARGTKMRILESGLPVDMGGE